MESYSLSHAYFFDFLALAMSGLISWMRLSDTPRVR